MPDTDPPAARPTIAVVAVHGIADQRPFDTVRQIADLLLTRNRNAPRAAYTTAHEVPLRIRVDDVKVAPPPARAAPPGPEGGLSFTARFAAAAIAPPPAESFHDLVHRLRKSRAAAPPTPTHAMAAAYAAPAAAADWDDASSVEQLFARTILRRPPAARPPPSECDPPPERVFETVRVETCRLDGGEPTCDVHVYEMYWADLSRLGTGPVAVFGEVFQILFHLCTLSRHTADAAMLENADVPGWRAFSKLTSWAVDALTLWVAALNILLVGVAVTVVASGALWAAQQTAVAARRGEGTVAAVAAWTALGVVAVAALAARWSARGRRRFLPWAVVPLLVPALVVVGLAVERWVPQLRVAERLWGWLAVVAGGVVAGLIGRAYARRRPGAGTALAVAGAVPAGVALALVATAPSPSPGSVGLLAGVTAFDLVMDLLVVWYAFYALVWLSSIAGWYAVRQTRRAAPDDPDRGDRAARAAFTARLLLVLSAALFTVVALPLWAAVWTVLTSGHVHLIPTGMPYRAAVPWLDPWVGPAGTSPTAGAFFDLLLRGKESLAFACVGAALLVGGVLAAWGLGPVVVGEVAPPPGDDPARSAALGRWLSHGYALMRVAGEALFAAVVVVYPVALVAAYAHHGGPRSPAANTVLVTVGGLAAASVGGLLAFRGRLDRLALGFRPIVDLLFDVDNHLREHPHGDNPRARTAARYASLLRYLAQWRSPTAADPTAAAAAAGGYHAVVVIAHSQGTAITADLLRFLRKEWPLTRHLDPELAPVVEGRLPVHLFTMGCPLRQLYSLRFPHLYRWARNTDPTAATYADPIPPGQLPLPAKLGVRRWANAFRSGDYVGRHLWRTDLCAFQWGDTRSADAADTRLDLCIGAGAHTHYWDHTAARIGDELDALIGRAAAS